MQTLPRPAAALHPTIARTIAYGFPRGYIHYTPVMATDLPDMVGQDAIVLGTIESYEWKPINGKKLVVQNFRISDSECSILECYKFSHAGSSSWVGSHGWALEQERTFAKGASALVKGKVKDDSFDGRYGRVEKYRIAIDDVVVGATELPNLVQPKVQVEVDPKLLDSAIALMVDPLPARFKTKLGLVELQEALWEMHHPTDPQTLAQARARLVFDEFFYLQLHLLQRRQELRQKERVALNTGGKLLKRFYRVLPFELTGAQQRVISEILSDLAEPAPMNRLVQGDVGAGKTVVAVAAILAAIASGQQAVLMAPTEVLAEQHYAKIRHWFDRLGLDVALLTGSTKASIRRELLPKIWRGEMPLVVGTHALLEDAIAFPNLGLVVIDEQHRFGVEQRAKLLGKGKYPHLLSMTATPIPRTLALTLHGDLDVSQIDELPPGRQPIVTKVISENGRGNAYAIIDREVRAGRQVYIILPLVSESKRSELKAAVEEFERLGHEEFPEFRLGLLHGKMKGQQKQDVLHQFREHQIDILVSTTVIEVGVDVPNATVMMIEHAERFGLAQLHQLRGRVGRGQHRSCCILVNTSGTDESWQRLRVMEESQDGFFIAEMDLQLRGPGELLSSKQSGLPEFALADLVQDQHLLFKARRAAEFTVQNGLVNSAMRAELAVRFPDQQQVTAQIMN